MDKSTWDTCNKPGSARCRLRISKDRQRIAELESRVEELTRAAVLRDFSAYMHDGDAPELSVRLPKESE